uniref:SCP domain-containing protein n=1 Tax=Zosterops lateralis melanops TaxID=1220523 RepID=A0A8D2QNY8_ZOSLA
MEGLGDCQELVGQSCSVGHHAVLCICINFKHTGQVCQLFGPIKLLLLLCLVLGCLGPEASLLWPDSTGVIGKCLVPVGEPSVPLCALFQSWDTDLEALAQSYAEKCIWDHNKERGRRGENLFAMAPTLELEFAVEDWNGEEKFYNLTTSTCVPGQMCGHYTQVVWSNTHQIGCGAHFCEKIEGIETENMHLLVCNYYPP